MTLKRFSLQENKLQPCLDSLKSAFSNDLKSRVVYKLSCSGHTSTYVGQTVRHLTTKIKEHKKADSPLGLHLQQCSLDGNSADLGWEIINRSNNHAKLLIQRQNISGKRNRA